jgi:hypothetical protein
VDCITEIQNIQKCVPSHIASYIFQQAMKFTDSVNSILMYSYKTVTLLTTIYNSENI